MFGDAGTGAGGSADAHAVFEQFFKNFGFTVVVAVLMSLAVARMITPMLAAYFLKAHGQAAHGEGRMMD